MQNYMDKHRKDPITNKPLTTDLVLSPNQNITKVCLLYQPFFDGLSAERRMRLVNTVMPEQSGAVLSASSAALFSSSASSSAATDSTLAAGLVKAEEDVDLLCPIRHEIMRDPVVLVATGHSFEREAIEEWFENNDTHPLTGETVANKTLVTNFSLKSLCAKALASAGMKLS